MSRDGTGAPSIRQSKAKKTHQEVGDRLRSAECDHPSAGSNEDCVIPNCFLQNTIQRGIFQSKL